jgi:hypothetical protein
MKAREFDKKFDEGGDISQHLDILLMITHMEPTRDRVNGATPGSP